MIARASEAAPSRSRSVSEEELRRIVRVRLDASLARRSTGASDWTVDENSRFSKSMTPRVSVIVTLFNYGCYLEKCLQSIAASEQLSGGVEIVVVDDCSTDDSADSAGRLIASTPIATRLVRKHQNTGLADARNVGVQIARGELVLTLDADNWLYPDCLHALAEAFNATGIAAAYPILRRYQSESNESLGLLSLYPWSVRELVRGPYIDALAMFRRDVLQSVGGYSTELIDYGWFGWEDYDLWLKLADAGHVCVQVPRILASYRVHADSMLHRTNRGTTAIAGHFQKKFQRLRRTYPDLERYFGFPSLPGDFETPPNPQGDELAQLRRHCRNLELERQAMYASLSWRLTMPLRAAYGFLVGPRPPRIREH
jgi:glycosyltransferase involved in cell wall biosynthesis